MSVHPRVYFLAHFVGLRVFLDMRDKLSLHYIQPFIIAETFMDIIIIVQHGILYTNFEIKFPS